jgi:putative glycosyl hydrolase
MQVAKFVRRFVVLTMAAGSIAVAGGVSAGPALSAQRVDDAAAVQTTGQGIATICAKRALRKTRGGASEASASTADATKMRRTRAALRRRCMSRYRRGASKNPQNPAAALTPVPGSLEIGIDGGYSEWNDEEVEMRSALGAAVTRHEWDPSEPVDSQDELVLKAAAEVHTRIHALLGANELGDPAHYEEWVVSFIRRYGVGGSFWSEHPELDASRYAMTSFELGNEPYYGGMSASQYADTVRPTLEAVQRLGLPARLILPSVIFGSDTSWMDTLYQRIPNLNSLFYAFADHPYWYGHDPSEGGNDGPLARITTLRQHMNGLGASGKPIFITEYGESTADCGEECVSESVQAEHLSEMLEAVVSHPDWGVKMVSTFQLHDWGSASSDREDQFGLLREDGTPKPAYPIVRGYVQQYRG